MQSRRKSREEPRREDPREAFGRGNYSARDSTDDGRRSRAGRERSRDGRRYQSDVADSRRRSGGSRERRNYLRESGPVESRRYADRQRGDYRADEDYSYQGRGRRGYRSRPERDGGRKREYNPVDEDGYRNDDYYYYKSLEDGLSSSPGHACTYKRDDVGHDDDDDDDNDDACWDRYGERSNRRSPRSPSPSIGIVIRNLPPDVTEEELKGLFASVPGTAAIELLDDQWSGKDEGEACAYLRMVSVDASVALMESDWRDAAYCRTRRMRLEFADRRQNRNIDINLDKDWICVNCNINNFVSRKVCFSCGSARTLACSTVDPNEPTRVLRISEIEQHIGEDALSSILKVWVPVQEVRFSWHRKSSSHRGIAFVYFNSVQDATYVMEQLDGKPLEGQRGIVRAAFTQVRSTSGAQQNRENASPRKAKGRVSGDATTAAEALEQLDWEPASFDEKNLNPDDGVEDQPKDVSEQPGFVYDPESGYMKDVVSGLFYDVNTGYYFDPTLQSWGTKDPVTGVFSPYQEPANQANVSVQEECVNPAESSKEETKKPPIAAGVINAAPRINKDASAPDTKKIADNDSSDAPNLKPKVEGVIHKGKWARRKQNDQQ
eukprot:jgi/Picsp_1/1870/NSC_05336-R1_rna-binding protein 5 10